jgi:hypothetical protein
MAGTLLTLQQLKAIELLTDGKRSQQSIADEIGVSRRTIVRWLADQEFQEALKGVGTNQFVVNPEVLQPQESPASIRQQLADLMPDVLQVAKGILLDENARTSDRLRACQMIGKWGGLEDRIDSTEQALEYLLDNNVVPDEILKFYVEQMRAINDELAAKFRGFHEEYSPKALEEA